MKMNTNVVALADRATVVDTTKVVFNNSTHGMDLRHEAFSLDAFEQKGNGLRLVIIDRRVLIGTEAALDNADAKLYRTQNLTQSKAAVSAYTALLQSDGGLASFKVGFHPIGGNRTQGFGEAALVKNNYAGMDIKDIPEDNQWHALVEKPVAGRELGDHYVSPKPVAPIYRQITHEMMDLIIDGFVIDMYWPARGNEKTEGLVDWFAVTLGSNEAVLSGDKELIAIYDTRYKEAVSANKLNKKAAKSLSVVEESDRKAVALDQSLVLMTIDGSEIDLLALTPGSLIRFEDRRGRHQGQRTWRPESAYSIQAFAEAAKLGMVAEVMFDAASNS